MPSSNILHKMKKSRLLRVTMYLVIVGVCLNIALALRYIRRSQAPYLLTGEEEAEAAYYRQIFKINVHSDDENIETLHSSTQSFHNILNYNTKDNEYRRDKVLERTTVLPKCPHVPPGLRGIFKTETSVTLSFRELETKYSQLHRGRYMPPNCTAKHKVAIIVPYRDRKQHLQIFLNHMHKFLPLQQLEYGIFVVELSPRIRFNRALLMNVGFMEASMYYGYDCFIFHDVDLLPENDWILYKCAKHNVKHLSTAVNKFNYSLPYETIFGGVTAITKEQFVSLNGFSNKFFGWGGEDDDMYNRIKENDMVVSRYPEELARYTMLFHPQERKNRKRKALLKSGITRWRKDGLNRLEYKVLLRQEHKLYTYILVDIDESNPSFLIDFGDRDFYREFRSQEQIDKKRAAEGVPSEDLQSIFS